MLALPVYTPSVRYVYDSMWSQKRQRLVYCKAGLFGVPVAPVVLAGPRPAPKDGGCVLAWLLCSHASTHPPRERPACGSRAYRAYYAVQEHQKALYSKAELRKSRKAQRGLAACGGTRRGASTWCGGPHHVLAPCGGGGHMDDFCEVLSSKNFG